MIILYVFRNIQVRGENVLKLEKKRLFSVSLRLITLTRCRDFKDLPVNMEVSHRLEWFRGIYTSD